MISSELQFILQLGILIVFTRLGGHWLRRWLNLPGVLGELIVGMIIGPYALGHIEWPVIGALFPVATTGHAVSSELYALATFASIILLFLSGLETDLSTFLRYSVAGTLVGIGGVIVSFYLGAGCAVWFNIADGWLDPKALFLGAMATATSVGISARILGERRKLDSPEGVTILAAAVFDDVLGIIVLAIVVGMVRAETDGVALSIPHISWIAAKAFGFWIGATAIGLLCARRFSRMLKHFKSPPTIAALALGFALLLAGLSELAGLAMIIGAYIMGLSLSRTDLVQLIHEEIEGLHNVLVPVFFATMGMMVDFSAIMPVLKIGLIYAVLAVISKVVGCGFPALLSGFNRYGALRIGVGMVPRGEVALVIAGIGLTSGAITQDIFGVAILMTVVTTLLGPSLLSASFENQASGLRKPAPDTGRIQRRIIRIPFASMDLAEFMLAQMVRAFRREEHYVHHLTPEDNVYHVRKDDKLFIMEREGSEIRITCAERDSHYVNLMLLEEMLNLRSMLHMTQESDDSGAIEHSIATSLFPASGDSNT